MLHRAIIPTDMSNERVDHGTPKLGQMNSMSPECTPFKHKYDDCFHTWFKDYLDMSSSVNVEPSSPPKQNPWPGRDKQAPPSDLTSLRERYETDCGKLFEEYQACVQVRTVCSQSAIHQRQGATRSNREGQKGKPIP